MAAPARQVEDTLLPDGTSLPSGETTFDYDLSAAFYARLTLALSVSGSVEVWQCISESSNTSDYPARAQGILLGVYPAGAASMSFECYQGLSRFRINNTGGSAGTATRARGRKYV